MPARRLLTTAVLTLITVIAAASVAWMRPVDAGMPAADFAAPMSMRDARAAVAAAQAHQAAQRQEIGRQLGVIDPRQLPLTPTVYFPQTGHHLSNRSGFLNYWRANGQMLLFGYPITEELVENGRIVQYFERARLELHPETPQDPIRLGLIGSELLRAGDEALAAQLLAGVADPQSGAGYFPETGHSLSGEIRRFWERHGGLAAFGFPISEELSEDGRTVQYFERARLEWWPEDMDAFFRSAERANGFNLNTLHEVRVSDVGRRLAAARGIEISPAEQLPGTAVWHPAIWQRHIDVNLSAQQLVAYEGELVVWRAPIATGRDGFNTPVGEYAIYYRLPMQDMAGSLGGESWYVPHIPWVQYVVGGVALHGTYWHDAHGSGVRMSHGCINLRIDDAQWLYEWADVGTTVSIHY